MERIHHIPGILLCVLLFLSACSDNSGSNTTANLASAPSKLIANAGDGAISIGWQAPASDGGAAISRYRLNIAPGVASNDVHISGTRALISGIANGIDYTISVAAANAAGVGPASDSISFQARAADTAAYEVITINNDPGSPNGFYDPSLLRAAAGDLWLAYSSVHYYLDGNSDPVQDVGIRIARSTDNGASFDYVTTVASPSATTVTDTDPAKSACGDPSCAGRWVYETSTLVEDIGDPDPDRRFKLFAHKYFLYPSRFPEASLYHLGAIVMFTASSPDADWSDENVLIGWPLSPPELSPAIDITTLDTELANCIILAEPGATVVADVLRLVFACPYISAGVTQKIVLLQSKDHGATLQYVNTLLTPGDAPPGIDHYSAPAVIATDDNAPVLLATPVSSTSSLYAGSVVFPFASASSNTVFRLNTVADSILYVPVASIGHIGGASTYARGTGNLGILQSDAIPANPIVNTQFRIIASHVLIEQ